MANKELTRRQVEVGRLLLASKSEYQIARALGVEGSTIRDHLGALAKKLDDAEGHGGIINALWIEHTTPISAGGKPTHTFDSRKAVFAAFFGGCCELVFWGIGLIGHYSNRGPGQC